MKSSNEKISADKIIFVFEKFLEDRQIFIPNFDKVEALGAGETIPNIYGHDYIDLKNMLEQENLMEKEDTTVIQQTYNSSSEIEQNLLDQIESEEPEI